jgi:hypothetical protein
MIKKIITGIVFLLFLNISGQSTIDSLDLYPIREHLIAGFKIDKEHTTYLLLKDSIVVTMRFVKTNEDKVLYIRKDYLYIKKLSKKGVFLEKEVLEKIRKVKQLHWSDD